MKDVVNVLQVAAVSLMVIPLGAERVEGRKARLEIVKYCRKNNIGIPTRKKPAFVYPTSDYWRANSTYTIFWNARITNPALNRISKISLLWDLESPPSGFERLEQEYCETYC